MPYVDGQDIEAIDTSYRTRERWALAGAHAPQQYVRGGCGRMISTSINLSSSPYGRGLWPILGVPSSPALALWARPMPGRLRGSGAQWGECACVGRRAESCGLKGSRVAPEHVGAARRARLSRALSRA
jgi:hypothetical protein